MEEKQTTQCAVCMKEIEWCEEKFECGQTGEPLCDDCEKGE